MAPFYNVFCVVVLLQGYLVTLVEMSHIPNDDWRLDKDYDPWSLTGTFIQGTPRQCSPPESPKNGRWVCSYGFGENGRSLCMVDCKRGHVIKDAPTIFNCDKGKWSIFPSKDLSGNDVTNLGLVPYGDCISYKDFVRNQLESSE
ncbi:uncharacterized protein LOC130628543 [Hydractinia symbiolongicarpus]|uniref:uncharacterized protein LOC130628543 n=1 Tax=Hydractinia symbiolongicarpus TaxID=13093 RepID=UPI00254B76C9|nr:uncharacterized protein LOC130628543 [Hydractinia symbiolongicarpus]